MKCILAYIFNTYIVLTIPYLDYFLYFFTF